MPAAEGHEGIWEGEPPGEPDAEPGVAGRLGGSGLTELADVLALPRQPSGGRKGGYDGGH